MQKQLKRISTGKQTERKNGVRQRIDLSGCKLVLPYGQDSQSLRSLSVLATKAGKLGLKSGGRAEKQKPKVKGQRIDLSKCKLVLPYGQDPQSLESLGVLATKAGKPGLRSVAAAKKQAPKAKGQRIDLSACKLVLPYGQDSESLESLKALATKAGKSGLKRVGLTTKQVPKAR